MAYGHVHTGVQAKVAMACAATHVCFDVEPIFGMHVASVGLVYCFSKILLTIFVKIVNYYVFGANYSAHHYYYLMSNMLFFMQFCCLSHDEIHVGVQS